MNEYYNVAGITMRIAGDVLPYRRPLESFACAPVENPDITFKVYAELADAEYLYTVSEENPDKKYRVVNYSNNEGIKAVSAIISLDWREVKVYLNPDFFRRIYFLKWIAEVTFYHICLFRKSIGLHAAAVEYNGGGIAVSAPAGTGKSTHCDLWVNNFGAEYINGDSPILKIINDEIFILGSPWSGSAEVYKNVCIPLTAIVFIEQYRENIIEKLSPAEAFKKMMPRCFLSYQNRDMMSLAMDNIEAVIMRTDCYLLKCTPDLEAAELVRNAIFKK